MKKILLALTTLSLSAVALAQSQAPVAEAEAVSASQPIASISEPQVVSTTPVAAQPAKPTVQFIDAAKAREQNIQPAGSQSDLQQKAPSSAVEQLEPAQQ